jgi:hypothetical protein
MSKIVTNNVTSFIDDPISDVQCVSNFSNIFSNTCGNFNDIQSGSPYFLYNIDSPCIIKSWRVYFIVCFHLRPFPGGNLTFSSSKIKVQSNLSTTTTLETPKLWPLLTDGHSSEVSQYSKNRKRNAKIVVVVNKWSFSGGGC